MIFFSKKTSLQKKKIYLSINLGYNSNKRTIVEKHLRIAKICIKTMGPISEFLVCIIFSEFIK